MTKQRNNSTESSRGSISQKIPQAESPGECAFALHCRADGLSPIREHVFHPARKWRLDFYFPEHRLGVEIEGGAGVYGRHQRPAGFREDCAKYNAAAKLGIIILRYTTAMVTAGDAINDVLEILGRRASD